MTILDIRKGEHMPRSRSTTVDSLRDLVQRVERLEEAVNGWAEARGTNNLYEFYFGGRRPRASKAMEREFFSENI